MNTSKDKPHSRVVLFVAIILLARTPAQTQSVSVDLSPAIENALEKWMSQNRTFPTVTGWRIQLLASTDRVLIEETKNKFRQEFPNIPINLSHEKPYHKLKVGAFRTRLEARNFIETLNNYSGAFPLKDKQIHPRDFL